MAFEKKFERAMKYVKKEDKVIAALSGGKDSAVMLYLLKRYGYNVEGMFIHLGIPEYSDKSLKAVEELTNALGVKLHIIKLRETYGKEINDFPRGKRCRFCGIAKRYIMNTFAYEHGFDVIATGHNMDDELAFYCLDVLSGNVEGFLRREYFIKGVPDMKMVAKVKPLYFLTDVEIKEYADKNNIPYTNAECPNRQSTQIRMKEILNKLDKEIGLKHPLFSFNRKIRKQVKLSGEKNVELRPCKVCGYPTTGEICSFCRYFRERLK